jgi:hypothetical protein
MKLVAVVAVVVLVAQLAPAQADSPALDPARKDQAALLVTEGSTRYDAKDFQGALDRYERAYAIYPAPKLHYNRALALLGLRRRGDAADEFERFITEARDAPPAALAHASEALIDLEKQLGRLAITSNAIGAVGIDGRAVGTTPLTVHLTPGLHEVRMTAAGRKPWRETLAIQATVTTRKLVELAPLELQVARRDPVAPDPAIGPSAIGPSAGGPSPASRDEPHRAIYGRWWFWGAIGTAVIAGAAITYVATRPPRAPATELGTIGSGP